MYAKVKIILGDPAVRTVERSHAAWFVSGATACVVNRLRDPGRGGQEEREICLEAGDVSIIKVMHDDAGTPVEVTLYRGLSSSHLIFIAMSRSNGEIVISDSFRAIMAALPPSMRSPSDEVIVDHFLFGNVSGTNTYSSCVKRIAHGSKLTVNLKTGAVQNSFFDKVPLSEAELTADHYLEAIDRNLKRFASDHVTSANSAVLFSGGVDSALLGCYIGPSLSYLNMRTHPTTFNARLEQQYCDDAAALLGVRSEVLYEEPKDYPDQLCACIDSLGSPPQALHMVWFDDAFRRTDYDTYFVAERADALFGHGGRIARFASHFTSPVAFQLLRLATAVLPPSNRLKWQHILPAAQKLREQPQSAYGYAAQTSMWTTPELVWRMFPANLIEERIKARLQYMLDRVELPTHYESQFHRHIELAQWTDYFCEDTLSLYRQCAHANGKTLLSPFLNADLLRIVARVPADCRYIKDGQGKYLLKRLLKMKLPEYQVNKRKAFPEMPFSLLYPNGTLNGIWERYDLPDFIDGDVRDEILSNPHLVTWQAVKYAMWEKEIRAAAELQLPSTSAIVEYDLRTPISARPLRRLHRLPH
ncbi:MAG: asparagine synthase-related protein [Kiloniellales bacterium]